MAHMEEGIRNLVLAGIGAAAIGYEKAQSLASDLVKRGETAVAEGKVINEELKRKRKKNPVKPSDIDVASMSPEDRATLMKKLSDLEGAK